MPPTAAPDTGSPLAFTSLCSEVSRLFRSRLGPLIVAGLLIFVPLGLIDTWLDLLPELEGDAGTFEVIGDLLAAAASVLFSLLGEVFYVAIVSAYVVAESEGRAVRLGAILRRLPLGRLLAADLAYAVLVAVGLVLLVVPGLIFLTWFTLVAPAIELEHRRFVDAFRRSRHLVRPRFWLVLVITVPLVLASELISSLVFSGSAYAFGHSFAGEWAGSVLAELLTAPFLALFVVVLFLRLREEVAP